MTRGRYNSMGNDKDYELVNKDGLLQKFCDGAYESIGSAIYVKSLVVNIDTDGVDVKFIFLNNGRKVLRVLRRDNVTKNGIKELTRYGAECWDNVAELYVEYFRNKLGRVEEEYYYSNVGWGNYKGQEFFRLNKAIGFDAKYNDSKYDLNPKGTLDDWINMVKDEVLPNRWLVVCLCVGFAAPLVKVIRDRKSVV